LASQGKLLQYGSGIWINLADDLPLTQLDARYLALAGGTVTGNVAVTGGRPWYDVTAFGADPTGTTDSTSAFTAAILAATGSATPATNSRIPTGPVYIPAGTYKITSDILIQSVQGFHLIGAGPDVTYLQASGTGFTTALLNIDGSANGLYEGFTLRGNGTDQVPNGLNLTWTTAANRSTTGNSFRDIVIRNLNFVTGFSLAGIGTRQLDGTKLEHITVTGQQVTGSWSTSGNWQYGVVFGNGSNGNIYDQYLYDVSVNGCYNGYYNNISSFGLWGAEPSGNCIDFYMINGAACTIENIQSQNAGQFIVCPSGSGHPVSFRDCEWKGYSNAAYTNLPWITTGTSYGNWVFENILCLYPLHAPSASPTMALGISGGTYNACCTLINVSQPNPPAAGIVSGTHTQVIAVSYQDTTSGSGTLAVLYPFYAVNAGVLYQQGTFAARPAAGTYGELFYYATDTLALYHSSGAAWTQVNLGAGVTVPQVNFYTSGATWTKPTSPAAATVFAYALGSGGGGGAGASGASGTPQCGGGGGAGAIVERRQFAASDLPSTVSVTVGAAASGGAAVTGTTGNTSGNIGTGGNPSSFGSYVRSFGGAQGSGGTTALGTGATSAGLASTNLGGGASASTTGGAGVVVQPAVLGAPGGPSGGGITTGAVAGAGAAGNVSTLAADATGGTAGAVGGATPGQGVASTLANGSAGPSPGSGAASTSGAAQAGANALANSGAGGAGGGASLNGNASGAGGNGGSGWVLVISYFQ